MLKLSRYAAPGGLTGLAMLIGAATASAHAVENDRCYYYCK